VLGDGVTSLIIYSIGNPRQGKIRASRLKLRKKSQFLVSPVKNPPLINPWTLETPSVMRFAAKWIIMGSRWFISD